MPSVARALAARRSARRRTRAPSRAERRARSPRPPVAAGLELAQQLGRRVEQLKVRALEMLLPVLHEVGHDPDGPLVRERLDAVASIVQARLAALELALDDAEAFGEPALDQALEVIGTRVLIANERELKRVIGINVRRAVPGMAGLMDRFREQNVLRIRGIPGKALVEVTRILERAESQSMRVETLAKEIGERFDVARSRAEMLARDQVLTLNAQVAHARMAAVGIEEGIWTTSGDERVRKSHEDLDGKRFRLDEGLVDEDTGERVLPGEPIGCRCTTFPVIPELLDFPDLEPVL